MDTYLEMDITGSFGHFSKWFLANEGFSEATYPNTPETSDLEQIGLSA